MTGPAFLSNQSVLRISGSDCKTFLQGLITNDIQVVSPTSAIYTLLLTPQGKFLYDFFVIEHHDYVLIDVHKNQAESLKKRLSLYKLRANVLIEDVSSEYTIFVSLDSVSVNPQNYILAYQDPRLKDLGNRWIVPREHTQSDLSWDAKDDDYNLFRLKLGIPQGYQDMIPERSIPLESGVQDLNAISWTKGCYIGQELMARTRYRGEIRKRLFPVERTRGHFEDAGPITNEAGDKVGELYSFQQNRGLARLKIEGIQKPLFIDGISLKIHQPAWINLTA
ncbi:MAG: YgfZ/GcvT domain-containing protein [Janthinobacterium lividum]